MPRVKFYQHRACWKSAVYVVVMVRGGVGYNCVCRTIDRGAPATSTVRDGDGAPRASLYLLDLANWGKKGLVSGKN